METSVGPVMTTTVAPPALSDCAAMSIDLDRSARVGDIEDVQDALLETILDHEGVTADRRDTGRAEVRAGRRQRVCMRRGEGRLIRDERTRSRSAVRQRIEVVDATQERQLVGRAELESRHRWCGA
jgi:hypothetical protein